MKIWLIKTGEPLPIDGDSVRLFRMGLLSKFLRDKGHDVTWWSSSFDHQNKRHRSTKSDVVEIEPFFKIMLLESSGYQKNISLDRLNDHHQMVQDFEKKAPLFSAPDIIVASFPTIGLSKAAIQYGRRNNVPVVIDVRDLWPDVIIDRVFGLKLSGLGRLLLRPMIRSTNHVMARATGLVSISEPMLRWALSYAKREVGHFDEVFPFGYNRPMANDADRLMGIDELSERFGLSRDKRLRICLFATLSNSFVLEPVIELAKRLEEEGNPVEFVICGRGEKLQNYKTLASGLKNFVFTGWVDYPTIQSIMRISDIGLAPYKNSFDFQSSIPNKAIEYWAGGLPILTSINGHLSDVIDQNNVGWAYTNDDQEELMNIVTSIMHEPDDLRLKKKSATSLYESKYRAEVVYTCYMDYLENIVNNYEY